MTTCTRCRRPLSDPLSVEAGMGPVCRAHGYVESDIAKQAEFADELDDSIPFRKAFVMKRSHNDPEKVGGVITNVPHLVVHHSPNGFEFGYGGSGPADLALNVCQLYLNIIGYEGRKSKCYDGQCWTLAWVLHQSFKRAFVERVSRSGAIVPFGKMEVWFKEQMTSEVIAQYVNDESDFDEE